MSRWILSLMFHARPLICLVYFSTSSKDFWVLICGLTLGASCITKIRKFFSAVHQSFSRIDYCFLCQSDLTRACSADNRTCTLTEHTPVKLFYHHLQDLALETQQLLIRKFTIQLHRKFLQSFNLILRWILFHSCSEKHTNAIHEASRSHIVTIGRKAQWRR